MSDQHKMIPEERAMELLGLPRRQLRTLIQSMDLQHHRERNKWYYDLREITVLSEVRKRSYQDGVTIPERVELLSLEVRKLHRMMRNIAQVLGFAHAFWEPTDEELYAAYEKVNTLINKYGSHKVPSETTVNEFMAVVSRLTEHEFRRMYRRYRNDPHPWRPFYQVAEQMQHALGVRAAATLGENRSALQHRMGLCMDLLRRAIWVYCAIVRPDQDFRMTMDEALRYPDRSIADVELAQLQTEDPDFANPTGALRRFIAV